MRSNNSRLRKKEYKEMQYSITQIRWLRIISFALAIIVLSFLILTLVATGYAFKLAFEARGKPDQAAIGHFTASISRWIIPLLEFTLTFLCAFLGFKKNENTSALHGLVLGTIVGLLSIAMKLGFGGQADYHSFINFLLIVGIGFLGGHMSQNRMNKK
jgi:putative membrane protein (TIGR04086 family)